jgi:hypothetical protein
MPASAHSGELFFVPLFAEGHDFGGIHRIVIDLHFYDLTALIDQVIHPPRCFIFGIVEAVLLGDVTAPVAQQREGDADFFRPRRIAEGAIHTYTQDLGVRSFQFLQILLEVLHLGRSTTGESENIKCQRDILLAAEVVQGNGLPACVE